MKKFQEFLFKDIGWKLLSIAIATILWFMVINIDQPVDTRSYIRPLSLQNTEVLTERQLTIGNLNELKTTKVTIKVKAQRTALDRLSQNPEWLQASVDFSQIKYAASGDIASLPIDVSVQGGNTYGISSKSPGKIDVLIEPLIYKELPIDLVMTGTLPEGVYLSEPTLSHDTTLVSGPASMVGQIASVRAGIDAALVATTPEVTAPLLCFDSNGTPISGIAITPESITASYTFHQMKAVPIQVDIIGEPEIGYQVGSVHCNPSQAMLVGPNEALEGIAFLQLDSINISDHSSSVTRTFRLEDYLPEGITLAENFEATVQILVNISPQSQRQVTLPKGSLTLLGQEDGLVYEIVDDAKITITGDNLETVYPEELQGILHVNGLAPGEHRVMIHTELPQGMELNPSYVAVRISAETTAESEKTED